MLGWFGDRIGMKPKPNWDRVGTYILDAHVVLRHTFSRRDRAFRFFFVATFPRLG